MIPKFGFFYINMVLQAEQTDQPLFLDTFEESEPFRLENPK